VYISEHEFTGGQAAGDASGGEQPRVVRRTGLWVGVSAAVVLVLATAGLTLPGRAAPAPAAGDMPVSMTAQPPVASSASSAAVRATRVPQPPEAPAVPSRPGDLDLALEHYRAALAEKPADPELLANVGQILVAMNKPAEAVPFLEQAVGAEPFSIVARFDLAVAYGRSGRLQEAVELYEGMVRSGEADVRVHHNLGLALRQLGRNADAATAFGRATELEPGQAAGWMGLALSLEADGRGLEAVTALERYLVLETSAPDADNVRARIARLRSVAEPVSPPSDAGNGASRR
jgi:pentatricopeptide repeat protein